MRVLVDIVHPAHVLFFARPIRMLLENGHDVRVVSRHKDVATTLLDEFGIEHNPISRLGRGRFGLARELVVRDARLLAVALGFKPDVMVGCGGVSISHVGALLGTRTIAFYENEIAWLQIRLTLPFISEWHVPRSYFGPTASGRTYRYNGIKELSYLHPDAFVPDWTAAIEAGLDPGRPNFFVRLVSWDSAHDFGKQGIRGKDLAALINWLGAQGTVHISAEGSVPSEFHRFLFKGKALEAHHLMAFCRLYVGESATMAAEAAMLGSPAFYIDDSTRGFIRELEGAQLVEHHSSLESLRPALAEALDRGRDHYLRLRSAFVKDRIDVAKYVVQIIAGDRG
jgi:uncharacterized protein